MKRKYRFSILMTLTVLVGTFPVLRGAGDRPPLPDGPLLGKAGDSSAWQILYSYPSDNSKSPPTPPQVAPANGFLVLPIRMATITRVKPAYHLEMTQVDGEKFEKWFNGEVSFYKQPGSTNPLVFSQATRLPFPNFGASGFPDMEWVSADTYTGVQSIGGHPCLTFSKGGMTVWIDLESRFPAKWQRGTETRIFQRLPDPTGLNLPPDVAKLDAGLKHDMDGWKQAASRGNH